LILLLINMYRLTTTI